MERLASALSDRYEIEQEIRSGMATVYLAHDVRLELDRRRVAIKALHSQFSSAHATERFLREVRVAAKLVHPNIVTLIEYDQVDNEPYYVMPYVDGGTLRDLLKDHHQFPINEAVRIATDVLSALEYAHSRGIVHRDIKPENILFSADKPMVADFGIARAITEAKQAAEEGITDGARIGTPAYMSPEQCAGQPADGRSDIYSLGCVLYEMLTGKVPFAEANPQSTMLRHISDPVPPISTVRPAVPLGLERAVLKALAKTPADRHASAREFAEELHKRLSLPDGVAPASVAVLPFENLSGEQGTDYFSDGITEEIINTLGQVTGLHVAAATSSFAFRGKAVSLEDVGEKLRVATVLRGSVRRAGSHLRVTVQLSNVANGYVMWSQRYDQEVREATDVFAVQDEIAKAVSGRLRVSFGDASFELPATPPTKNLEAYTLFLNGRSLWGQRGLGLNKALALFGQAVALDPNYAAAHAGFADCCILLAEYGALPPGAVLPKARAAIQRALELAPDLPEAHCASGELSLAFDWNWQRARTDLRRAIELSPRYSTAHYRLALYLSLVAGDYTEGLTHARQAVELDPLAPLPQAQLGVVLMAAERYEEAIAALQRATELPPAMLAPYLYLGGILNHVGRTPEAIECLINAAAASGRHPSSLTQLAGCYRALGDTAKVQAIYDELTARARGGGEYIQKTTLAVAAGAAGRIDEAFQLLDRAFEEHDSILLFSKRHPAFFPLQADPRMADLYRRIGFPSEPNHSSLGSNS
ncbi:MAG TPA: protein kinase [Gemmatimonadales bacterium]|nr:protein kinase [Gemmatimonadales bacterium]